MTGNRILLLILVLGGAALALLIHYYGYERTWSLWNIPSMDPHFADLRTITGGAESHRRGLDPLAENPADPWRRTMDYPRVWEGLFLLGIDQGDTSLIGAIMIALFAAGLLVFGGGMDRLTAVVMGLGVFSPAVLFGIERGNKDLLIFFLLAAALAVLRRSPLLFTALVTLGAVLVYFPLFGLVCLLCQPRRRCLLLGGVSLAAIAIYMALTWRDMWLIELGSLKGAALSYGFNVVHTWVQPSLPSAAAGRLLTAASLAAAIALFAAAVRARAGRPPALAAHDQQNLDAFRLGAAIYAGTFLLGNNWDYRLIFLLFAIPQLVQWSRGRTAPAPRAARWALALLLASLWMQFFFRFAHFLPAGGHVLFAVDELCNWTLLGLLLFLLARTAPQWLARELPRPGAPGGLAGSG